MEYQEPEHALSFPSIRLRRAGWPARHHFCFPVVGEEGGQTCSQASTACPQWMMKAEVGREAAFELDCCDERSLPYVD